MIFNIRGTHGSGKTWTARQLAARMELVAHHPLTPRKTACSEYRAGRETVFLLGNYNTEAATAGVDNLGLGNSVVAAFAEALSALGHVTFEGILSTNVWQSYADLARRADGFWFVFLNTPLERSLSQLNARRRAVGKAAYEGPWQADTDKRQQRYIKKARAGGYDYWVGSAEDAVEFILEKIRGD